MHGKPEETLQSRAYRTAISHGLDTGEIPPILQHIYSRRIGDPSVTAEDIITFGGLPKEESLD